MPHLGLEKMSIRTRQRWPSSARRLSRFRHCERGTATVEAVIWLPAFFSVLCLIVDLALIFNGQTLANRVVEDANRSYSVGWLTTTDAVENQIRTALSELSPNAEVDSVVDGGTIFSQVVIPSTDLAATGWFSIITGTEVAIRSAQMIEY
jgi:Flp pilus assembly protein TadG